MNPEKAISLVGRPLIGRPFLCGTGRDRSGLRSRSLRLVATRALVTGMQNHAAPNSPLRKSFSRPLQSPWALALAQATDQLPSWNEGAAKTAIIEFVHATTDTASPKFVPPEARIATFDQDGTTWVSHPMYTQVMYCLDRVPAVVKAKPELANVEPFKTVLSGNREAIAKLPTKDLYKILAATLTGMSVEQFSAEAKDWIATAKHPRWDKLYTELTYEPMLEVMRYLRANGYKK